VITGAPLDIVAVDVLSGLPATADGNKYVLVLTDYFTKWACAFALPDAEASTCMRVMYDGFFASQSSACLASYIVIWGRTLNQSYFTSCV